MVDWHVEGIAFGNCNCDYGCPCQFERRPTHGDCRGFEVLRIDRGHFGDVRLEGLRTAVLYAWPGAIFEGGGTMQAIIDERADARQRQALATILHGGETEEAKTHWWVFHAMSSTVHEPLFKPIEFELAEIGSASSKATGPVELDLDDSYGQFNLLRHSGTGVVHARAPST
jgi:hypothetical protein